MVLQGDILFIFEVRGSARVFPRTSLALFALGLTQRAQDRRSLRLRRALWLDGYELSGAPCVSEEGDEGTAPPVELRHARETAPGARLALRTAAAAEAWRAALGEATRSRGLMTAEAQTAAAQPAAAIAPPPAAATRDAEAQAGDAEEASASARAAVAAEGQAAEAKQAAALLTWQLADARAIAADAQQAAAAATARADALAAELAKAQEAPPAAPPASEPLPPPWTPSSVAAVQLPGAPGDASPRTPQQQEPQAAPATPTAPRKAHRPAVWPAAGAHAARRTLHYGEP